jgi:hypothetical protein
VKAKTAGRIAKYLATSFAIENVVRAPRVISTKGLRASPAATRTT